MKPPLCLNMIVRNENARIERCLKSVLPYVKSVAILDTGSTDGTQDTIKYLCAMADVPCVIEDGQFKDFSQARNEAFALARKHNHGDRWCQFALLVDADMVLVAEPNAFDNLDGNAPSYDMMQKGGAVSYGNRRILNLNVAKPPYVGVTHEYIDVPAFGMIEGARFLDYADGSNRADKFSRDAQLLNDALRDDRGNARYQFYLANTYRDWGKHSIAINHYKQRIAMGGWDEETHSAMMSLAHCHKARGNTGEFVSGLIAAYNFRPSRVEPLHDLAVYYREAGNNTAAAIFTSTALGKKRPNDLLFVNDYVYEHGIRYEHSIVASYNPETREQACEITNDLALDPTCPEEYRVRSRLNLFWHTEPLAKLCPSFKSVEIDFTPPEGYVATNPSVHNYHNRLSANVRCVNYRIDEHGRYIISGGGEAIDTRNFLVNLNNDLSVQRSREIIWERPAPVFDLVTGLEDIRLWRVYKAGDRASGQDLRFSATVREQSPNGTCQMFSGAIEYTLADDVLRVTSWKCLSGEDNHEKNWMPAGSERFMYRLDTIIEPDGSRVKHELPIHVGDISGSSQLVQCGLHLIAVVHEAIAGPDGKRTYWHRFAMFNRERRLVKLSRPFVFFARQIEFCAGLAMHPNKMDLVISFGERDEKAILATVSADEVLAMDWKTV